MTQPGEGYRPGPPPLPDVTEQARRGAGPLCPSCGARRVSTAGQRCWLCEEALPPVELRDNANPASRTGERVAAVLGLILLLFVLLLLGLSLAEAPGLALLVLIPLIPAGIRASVATRRDEAFEGPQGGGRFFSNFLVSLGLVTLVAAAAGVAFFATCFAVCLGVLATGGFDRGGEAGVIVSVALGIPPGIAVFVWLIRKIWPKKAAR